MNCLPTSKLLSVKSKNKYLLSATQKYEQRIKDAKQKQNQDFPCHCGNVSKTQTKTEHVDVNPCLDDWITKRKEIDKWRKSVIFALQNETADSTSSSIGTDSLTQPESSTLTTSNTLCSANEAHKKNIQIEKKIFSIPIEKSFCKVPKSPSIPLYNSNSKGPPESNHAAFYYDFYARNNHDSAISIVDDDDVFVPCESSQYSPFAANSSGATSSNKFNFFGTNDSFQNCSHRNENNVNKKYTPQPTKRPFYFPITQYNEVPVVKIDKIRAKKSMNTNTKDDSRTINRVNSDKFPSYQGSSFVKRVNKNQESMSYSTKKTLHRNETNAKIVLRPANSSQNNDFQGNFPFQRTRSLNIKRSPQNIVQTNGNYENVVHNFIDNGFSSSLMKTSLPRVNQSSDNARTKGQIYSTHGQSNFIVLKPTFSQENINYPSESNGARSGPLLKISSYSNLQSVSREIPKVSINEPLTMKFVFGSEPSLLRNF